MECPSCGNQVAETSATCDACGSTIPRADMAPQSTSERGWGAEAQSFDCEGCGAQTVFNAGEMVLRCPYCDSEKVIQLSPEQAQDVVQPEYVVPFAVKKEEAGELFHQWVTSLWFAPGDLKQRASAERARGVYLPFWVYDVDTNSYFHGEYGEHYYEEVSKEKEVNGQKVMVTEKERRTRWHRGSGWATNQYRDVLVCASKGVEPNLVRAIEPWKLDQRQPYAAGFLAGWEAERYAIDEDQAWKEQGQKRVLEQEQAVCARKLKEKYRADEVRGVQVEVRYDNLRSIHMLLPAYISAYQYGDKTYRFMINGQTREVQGERPYSMGKIALFVAVIVALLGGLFFVLSSRAKTAGTTGTTGTPAATSGITPDANTSKATAQPLRQGQMVTGYASKVKAAAPREASEGSWYVVEASGKVTVQLSHALGNEADIDLEVQDESGKVLARGETDESSNRMENVQLEHRGKLYVRAYYYSGSADLFQYKLQVVPGHAAPLPAPARR